MELRIGDATLRFAHDEDTGQLGAVVELQAWHGFACDNSRDELRGARVQLVLAPPDHGRTAEPAGYEQAIAWLFAHQETTRQSVLDAIAGYIDVLRDDYGIDDDELDAFRSVEQLHRMVDLSFVHVYPQSRAGLPYLGFELECNWDPEHGCGLLLHGAEVLDVGGAESAESVDPAGEHDAPVVMRLPDGRRGSHRRSPRRPPPGGVRP